MGTIVCFYLRLNCSLIVWFCFCCFFPPLLHIFVHVDGIHASFPQFPTVCLFPWGFILRLKGSFCTSFASLGLLRRCSLRGRPLQWHWGSQHTLFHTGHFGQAADLNNFWLGLHEHMGNVLIQIIAYSTLPYPLYHFPRSWSCLPCLSAKKVFCLFGNWGRRARVADMQNKEWQSWCKGEAAVLCWTTFEATVYWWCFCNASLVIIMFIF